MRISQVVAGITLAGALLARIVAADAQDATPEPGPITAEVDPVRLP